MKLNELLHNTTNDRVFVFQSHTHISMSQFDYINQNLKKEFFPNWYSHEVNLFPKLYFLNNHFIIISTCLSDISGCAIDALTHQIREIGLNLGLNFFNRLKIPFFQHEKHHFSHHHINDIEIQFLDYKVFVNKYKIDSDQNLFVFNNRLTHSDELWIVSLEHWFKTYIKNN